MLARAGEGRPRSRGQRLDEAVRLRPRGFGSILGPPLARGRVHQVEPEEDRRPEHRRALLQRAQERAEGVGPLGSAAFRYQLRTATTTVARTGLSGGEGTNSPARRLDPV